MALPTPLAKDFDVSLMKDRPAILAVFRPTDSRYEFNVLMDKADRARVGSSISPAYQVHQAKTGDLGRYIDSEVLEVARRLATAMADKITAGA
jgi:hypothetical protein